MRDEVHAQGNSVAKFVVNRFRSGDKKDAFEGGNSGDGSRWQGNVARSDVGVVHGGEAVGDGGRSADGR